MFDTLESLYHFLNYNINGINEYMKYEKEILDIFNNNNIEEYTNNENLFSWIGIYYQEIEKDYDKMKEYYLMAIDKDDSDAMNNLGHYYEEIEKNIDKMKEHFWKIIEDKSNDEDDNDDNEYARIASQIAINEKIKHKDFVTEPAVKLQAD